MKPTRGRVTAAALVTAVLGCAAYGGGGGQGGHSHVLRVPGS
jgi:hypothetical protein